MDRREGYKVRDVPQEKGGWGSLLPGEGEGHKFLHNAPGESDQMGIHTLG